MSTPANISERTAKFLGLNYKKCANGDLFDYSDADWAGDVDDRHSTGRWSSELVLKARNWLLWR